MATSYEATLLPVSNTVSDLLFIGYVRGVTEIKKYLEDIVTTVQGVSYLYF